MNREQIEAVIARLRHGIPQPERELDSLRDLALRGLGAAEPVAITVQPTPYEDGTPRPGTELLWSKGFGEDSFPLGTKLYAAPPEQGEIEGIAALLAAKERT
jgi:hypothetical protein